MKKHNDNKCANCGADRHHGSTLCADCIVACGGLIHTPSSGDAIIMHMFRGLKKVAELDVTNWSDEDIGRQVDIQVRLQNRWIEISRQEFPIGNIGNFNGPAKESALPPSSGKGKIS